MADKLPIDQVKALKARHSQLVDARLPSEGLWTELRKYIRPEAKAFYSDDLPGQQLRNRLFDGTAAWANEQLANAIVGLLMPKNQQWFFLTVDGVEEGRVKLDWAARDWLQRVSDIIYSYYLRPSANAGTSGHEICMDVGGLGTGIEHQTWDEKSQGLVFRPLALADCWLDQDYLGRIDTLHRRIIWNKRQLLQAFQEKDLPEKVQKSKKYDEPYEIVHAVFPREDRIANSLLPTQKAYASVWFMPDVKAEEAVLKNSGFDIFPYATPRFFKRATEVYGRGPGANCLPNVRYLQSLKRVNIKGKTKLIDPALLVPHDGILTDVIAEPSALIHYEADAFANQTRPPITPLLTGANPNVGDVEIDREQNFILQCFYAEWFQSEQKKERQTATEIIDNQDQRANMMSPNLGRIETEYLDRRIARSYNLLKAHGKIPDAPSSLRQAELKVRYETPARRAQRAQQSLNDRRFVELILPLAELEPGIMDEFDLVEFAKSTANNLSVSQNIRRKPKDIDARKQAREDQQQQDALMQNALPASQAIKNVAQAQNA